MGFIQECYILLHWRVGIGVSIGICCFIELFISSTLSVVNNEQDEELEGFDKLGFSCVASYS